MNKTKIAISGIGAVGGYYGGLLAARYKDSEDIDIYFISRGENLEEIRKNGIEVKNTFLTIIGPNTVIIPLLNGADIAERIQKLLPNNEVWKGCVYISSRLVRPGRVEKFTIKDRMFFGSKQGNKKRQKDLQDILANARILTTIPDDIDLEIWKKFFMISTAATITSYFNETIGEVVNNHIDLFITLGYELKSVAEAKGIRLPDGQVFSAIDAQKIMPNNSTTSMHSDFQKGNRTEVETLTGYVVRTAQELGIEVPTYQFMYKGLTEFPYPVAD